MKRMTALLLTLVMMFSVAVPAMAAEEDGLPSSPPLEDIDPEGVSTPVPETTEEPEPTQTPAPEETEEPAPTATPEATEPTSTPEAEPSASPEVSPSPSPDADASEGQLIALINAIPASTGEVELTITKALELGEWTPTFTVALTGAAFHTMELAADGTQKGFHDLPAGEYTLTVTGKGFAKYTQSISVGQSDGMLVKLTAGRLAGYDSGAHPGVLQIGDVTGDGAVDQADREMMMQAVDGQAVAGFTDLNGDGVTTLADAEYLAKGLDIGKLDASLREATLERYVPAAAVASVASEGTEVLGMENLFQDNGASVTLSTADDQPISLESPVEVTFGLADGAKTDAILIEKTNISAGTVLVEYDDGAGLKFVECVIGAVPVAASMAASAGVSQVSVVPDAQGNITVDLGSQVAVKRVKLTITGTTTGSTLAEISQVEFVNGMDERIPEPQMDVPQNVTAVPGSRQFTVSWGVCSNITGYEVEISAGGVTEIVPLTGTSLTVTNFNKDEVRNYTTYTIRVQSVNGAWSSRFENSAVVTVTPEPTGRPDKPDNVKATGGFQMITVSWKNMKDTERYNLYYKEAGASAYTKIPDLTVTSYVISGLNTAQETKYEVYVTGVNKHGESDPSMHASARTTTLDPPDMPRFNLINRDASGKPGTTHITSAVMPNTSGRMIGSTLDTGTGTVWGTVDGNPSSYYERATWDDGGYNNLSSGVGLIYSFDGTYKMDTIGMMSVEAGMDYTYLKIRWWDAAGAEHLIDRNLMVSEKRTDAQGRTYFFLRLPGPIEATKIQIGVARYWAGNNRISVSEVYFYKYDSLKQELADLYADDLHTTLKEEGITEESLNALKARIETSVDEFGEVNPDKDQLLKEWETAWQIFHDQFLSKVTYVHNGITASGDDHGFGGLNAWQPLGVTAAAGEKITVYVSHNIKKTGSATNLQLVATQYHAEASAMSKVLMTLKVGANEIQIPKIWTTEGFESGGALYVQYTGGAGSADQYAVRVSGGVSVPVLDLYQVADNGERMERVSAYLSELQTYVANIPALHSQKHQGEKPASVEVALDFDNQNCILGATDIMLNSMMLSLPAQQVVAGCGGDAQKLLNSLIAMENMMTLFYQHKGLNASAANAVDRLPNRHLNIRYQRMFSGAFMYASGDHIGIEWPETAGMAGCGGVRASDGGLYSSGNYFGWGIAHEIGHDINQGSYAIAEITNNYFAVLAQAQDTNGSVRFEYPKVYEKVTSGTKGPAGNVFTQLGMYWQLHLAYDKGYNFRTYANYDEQLANLFFARVDTYARTPSRAPKPGGVALTLTGADVDQTIMRLACAAAEKNILDFFQRWGKTPDETTTAYASQFPAETRAIYYVCDDSRRYTIEHGGNGSLAEGPKEAISSVTVAADPNKANKVDITITPNGTVSPEEILGYEIVRCTIAGGQVEKRTVGFTTTNTFSDVISAMNNRSVSYEVTLVDQYLNRSAVTVTQAVKIEHEGDLAKDNWTVEVSGLKADQIVTNGVRDENGNVTDPEIVRKDASTLLIDGDVLTAYGPLVEAAGAAITIDFHETQVITGFRYTAGNGTAIAGYVAEVRQNGEWVQAATGELNGTKTVYFSNVEGAYVSTYAADGLRLTLTGQAGQTVSAAELDVLGPTGDNVDFRYADSAAAIGYLQQDFQYGKEKEDVIPAGSLVFTGSYKGNAAYNVVMLYDGNGNVVAGAGADGRMHAYQAIMSDVPKTGNIQDTNDGVWLYWIQPEDLKNGFTLPSKVRAELYRVNNAQTNEGERLVSDSLFVEVPQQPGSITLSAKA